MTDPGSEDPLTPREREMRQLLLAGEYSEAAKRFFISEKTVRSMGPHWLEHWERKLARTAGPATSGPEPGTEIATHTETVGEDESGTPRASPTRRQIPGKGKPQPYKRRDRE